MKKIRLLALAFSIVFGGASVVSFAQTGSPVIGGYSTVATTDAQVVAAANFAVKFQSKKQKAAFRLADIFKAEQQVVAGMNYRLCLAVQVIEKGKKSPTGRIVQAIIFKDLNRKLTLTSWAVTECVKIPEQPFRTN